MNRAVRSLASIFFLVLIPSLINGQTDDKGAEWLNTEAVELIKAKQYSQAIGLLERSIKLKPSFATAHVNMGVALHLAGDSHAAVTYMKTGIELDDSALARNQLGVALTSLKQYDAALGHLKKAVELKPDYTLAWVNLASVYFYKGNLKKAAETLEAIKSRDPSNHVVRTNLGQIYAYQYRFGEAIEELSAVKRERPGDETVNVALCELYLLRNDRDSALEIYRSFKSTNTSLAEKLFESISRGRVVSAKDR
ncbi:MAG TPA: tetratricopeptide repeat protein [Pyrinomonadaceae bacterium]|nr:tetratricopeptide repeat protein [Pyrinomonadaceae bacterium]